MSSLRERTGRALVWDLFGNYGGQMVNFTISIFLARLLDPEEFGLVGMSLVFISILRVFTDMGFASALVQSKQNKSITYSSIFYVNIIAGFLLTIIIFFSAPLIGAFYENDTVTLLVRLLSVTYLINAFNIVQISLFRKELNFKVLTVRDLISQIIAGIMAIIFAFNGYGVFALVIQNLLATVINTIILWKLSVWHPKWEFSWLEVRKLTGFSGYVFAGQSLNQIIAQADTLIIGKLFSAATLGFFSRANSVNSLIAKNSVSSIAMVFFPVLSKLQDDEEKFQQIYLRVIDIVASISIFLTGIFFLCGEELIIGLFGTKWEPSVFIFQILVINGFTYPLSAMIVSTFMAKGKSKENFHYGNIRKILQLAPLIFAYLFGFKEFLYAIVAVGLISWLLNHYFVTRSLKVPYLLQANAVFPHLVVALFLVIFIYIIFPTERNYLMAILKVLTFITIYFFYLYKKNTILFQECMIYKDVIWQKIKQVFNLA